MVLKALRHRGFQRQIFIGLAIVIIPSFMLWGVMLNREDSKTNKPLGRIGSRAVSAKDYLDSYRAVQHQLQFSFGDRWNEMRRYINLKGEAWDRMLLFEEAKRRGIRTSDDEVVRWIAGQPAFQRKGKYYPELYRMAVRDALRMEPRDFEEEMRRTLTVQKLSESIVSGIRVDDAELKALYTQERAARDIEYVALPADTTAPATAVDEKDIEQLYGQFKDRLTVPARVRLRFLTVPQSEWETRKDVLADNSTGFDDLAKKAGLTPRTTAYFSRNEAVPEIGLSREILAAAFSLPNGGESPWIPFENASFKIKVDDRQPERPMTLDEAREEIRRQVLESKAIQAAVKKLEELKPALEKDGMGAAKTAGYTVQSFDGFKPESYLPGVGPGSGVASILAPLKEAQVSAAFPIAHGAAIVRVKKDHAPDDAAFEKDKDDFRKEVLARKAQDAIKDLLDRLRQNLMLDVERMKEIFPEDETR